MTLLTGILALWLAPALMVGLGLVFYVPYMQRRHRRSDFVLPVENVRGPADDLALRREAARKSSQEVAAVALTRSTARTASR